MKKDKAERWTLPAGTMIMNSAFGTALITVFMAAGLTQVATAQDADVTDLRNKIIGANAARFANFPQLSFEAQSETIYAKDYLEKNPARKKLDHLSVLYTGLVTSDKYRINSSMTMSDGTKLPAYQIAYDGERYEYLNAEGKSWISVSKRKADAPDSVPLGTFIYLPYSFLFDSDYNSDFSIVSATDLSKAETWNTSFAGATVERWPTGEDPTAEIKFRRKDGSSYKVTFSKEYSPLKFEKFDAEDKLSQRYTVDAWRDLQTPGKANLPLPASVRIETFLSGWPRLTMIAKLNNVAPVAAFDENDYGLDLSSVDHIWDEDNKVSIPVPR